VNVPPVSGLSPDLMGSSQRGRVTRPVGLASGRPPGPVSSPPAPVLSGTLVVLRRRQQAGSTVDGRGGTCASYHENRACSGNSAVPSGGASFEFPPEFGVREVGHGLRTADFDAADPSSAAVS